MTRSRGFSVRRAALMGVVLGLGLLLSSDRGLTATIFGIDPLEVLNFEIKPNVLIILDSSGSMNDTPQNNTVGGDWPPQVYPASVPAAQRLPRGSKIGQAKVVLQQFITGNKNNASFSFGQYTQQNDTLQKTGAGQDPRFAYYTTDVLSPSMATTELILGTTVGSALDATHGGGVASLFAFQWIQDTATPAIHNTLLHFTEGAVTCDVAIPTGFYETGTSLAVAITTAMNSCSGKTNVYTVTYTVGTGKFAFTAAGPNGWTLKWSNATNSIRGVLNAGTADASGPFTTGDARIKLLHRTTADKFTETLTIPSPPPSPAPPANETTYRLIADKFWNGQTFSVLADGTVCGISNGPQTNPPQVFLQGLSGLACAGSTVSGTPVAFIWGGGYKNGGGGGFGGNNISCLGYKLDQNLVACDQTSTQDTAIEVPFLQPVLQLDVNGNIVNNGYTESPEGTGAVTSGAVTQYGVPADGSTPIAGAISDIQNVFHFYWDGTAIPVRPSPQPQINAVLPTSGTISTHLNPQEPTILIFVTDGDDTCAPGTADQESWVAAHAAELLYRPIVGGVNPDGTFTAGTNPASSVSTYMVGLGSGADVNRLNAIAYGGTGLIQNSGNAWTGFPTAAQIAACVTCHAAFLAPDAPTLAAVLQSILEQGSKVGSFSAQQAITESVFEYSAEVLPAGFADPLDPHQRYLGIVPIAFQSTFSLPGYQGHVAAFENVGTATPFQKWDAGAKLLTRVQNGMNALTPLPGAAVGEGVFVTPATASSITGVTGPGIPRQIFTTAGNGTFPLTLAGNLFPNTQTAAQGRVSLWPPDTTTSPTVAPFDSTTQGFFDQALGLPLDTDPIANQPADFATLQAAPFFACTGAPLPAACTSGSVTTQLKQARREAREQILAFMAGAQASTASVGQLKRVQAGSTYTGFILYKARPFVLAESTLATPAIVSPPLQETPDGSQWVPEYILYRDGARNASNITQPAGILQGFGLRNPDFDASAPPTGNDTRFNTKPIMTVVYQGANDMLHAFRAGPNCDVAGGTGTAATYPTCAEQGGEELWGFVPYDQLADLKALMSPQTRANKTYMIAASIRFGDVFYPAPGGTYTQTIGGATVTGQGVWRKFIMFGRGIGGKYFTALDVTGAGPFTGCTIGHVAGPCNGLPFVPGPLVYWSRGNPDTVTGVSVASGGVPTNSTGGNADELAYRKMGQTWSVPALAFVGTPLPPPAYVTPRRPGGAAHVAFVGSGYSGTAGEGTAFYTLDLLTGDVVASVDVDAAATGFGLGRTVAAYADALPASAAAFNPSEFNFLIPPGNPGGTNTTRVYIPDLYGRLWKFLAVSPSIVVPFADLGADQPVSQPAGLLGIGTPATPHVYVESGAEIRANGPFKIFGFRDDGSDTDTTPGTQQATSDAAVFTYDSAHFLFDQAFQTSFRGTAQPATAFGTTNSIGRVFFLGTRFNAPATPFAPPVPPYPCRSSFDSIVYALGAESGSAAYNLNASGNQSYTIFSGQRYVAVNIIGDPTASTGGTRVGLSAGLGGAPPPNPPPPGQPPVIAGAANLTAQSSIMPSTVCHQ